MTELSSRGPSIGFLEMSSIADGVEATDAMMKRASVDLLTTTIVPRGEYLVMVGGAVADVDAAMQAGREGRGDPDRRVRDPERPPAAPARHQGAGQGRRPGGGGLIETREVASAIYATDAAVKAATVTLIEARNQPGAKGLVVLTGEVGAVRAAVAAGVATIKKDGMLVAEVVIPRAHEALAASLTA